MHALLSPAVTDPQLLAASPCAHPAYEHDELGALKMDHEQTQMGLEKPPVQYADGARVSAQKLVQAQAEGREIIGPALPGPLKQGRFSAADFQINVEQRAAFPVAQLR